eukprot:6181737-Pleurochrysis_carterae.AAC.4
MSSHCAPYVPDKARSHTRAVSNTGVRFCANTCRKRRSTKSILRFPTNECAFLGLESLRMACDRCRHHLAMDNSCCSSLMHSASTSR